MELEKSLEKALVELRKSESAERKFNQTVDLIINLQKFDAKKNQTNVFVNVPFKIKDKKICAFLEVKSEKIDTVTPEQFKKYTDKKELKKLVKKYDFFVAEAGVMPKVAMAFGKVLGPVGKMPSPQLGVMMTVNEKEIAEIKKKIENSVKVRIREPSVKMAVGKQSMKDSEIVQNTMDIYNAVVKALPKGVENVKNVEIKFTMTKPEKIAIR